MEMRHCSSKSLTLLSLLCLCLIAALCIASQASALLPWETENTVRNALAQQEGTNIVCEGAVERISARNNPAFFVLRDSFASSQDTQISKVVVLCRPPVSLGSGQSVIVEGTLGVLPGSNERCICNPTIYSYFKSGKPQYWTPFLFLGLESGYDKQVLQFPITPIPASDPSIADYGMGISGEVSAYSSEGVARFDTVASLIATAPPVLTPIEISCKPVREVGECYIVVGDDNSNAAVKVYVNTNVKSTDRVLTLRGRVHSENGNLVIYAGSGVCPFFDVQDSFAGSISLASVGTVAYASTLGDSSSAGGIRTAGVRTMSVSSPSSMDGSWVYLTGQVVTFIGQYYSYDVVPNNWINVYNIQSIDRTSGMRVWCPAYGYTGYSPSYIGSVVDVMAKVNTKDGQRMLGVWNSDEWNAIDLSSSTHCIEPKILADGDYYYPLNVTPVGIINRDLCGAGVGYNPSVSGGQGLYNVGNYVTVWGKVLETGTYQFDQNGSYTTPYMVVDDGSGTPTDDQDVTVFGTSSYSWWYDPVAVGDYVSVTGVSSIWKPDGSSDKYRSVWTSDYARNQGDPPQQSTREVTETGTISGTVKLYDMPESTATVRVYSTCGRSETLTVNRGGNNSGSATFSWSNVPKTVLVDSYYYDYPQYIVSAKCDNFKTRTYTGVAPWTGTATPRNIYIPRLRKIYVTTNSTNIDPCGGSAVITAKVVDSDHNPIQGVTVRFRTDKGSFSSGSIVHNYTPGGTTNAQGEITATLYGVPSESGYAIVEATDDSAPLVGDDPDDDTYKYDWQQVHDNYGQPINIYISQPSTGLQLTANPTNIDVCGTIQSAITAHVTGCGGSGLDGVDVTFGSPDPGLFSDNSTQKTVTTTGGGYATVYLKGNGTIGEATVSASASPYGINTSNQASAVTITTDTLTLSANPVVGQVGQSVTITANVKDAAGNNVSGRTVYFSQTGGNAPASGSASTNGSGNATWTVSRSTTGKVTVTAYEDMTCSVRVTKTLDVWFYDTTPEDWPMFMHDPQHTGMSKTWDVAGETLTRQWVVSLPTASTIRGEDWSYQDPNTYETISHPNPAAGSTWIFQHPYIDSSPVVVGNKVVVGTWTRDTNYPLPGEQNPATGSVKAFNAASNGSTLWTATGTPSMGGVASTPCISDGKVYVGTTNGYLYCLDLSNGNQIWARQTTNRSATPGNSPIISSPVVHNGVVYVTNEASKVYAFTGDSNGTLIAGYPIVLPIDQSGHGDGGNGVTDVRQQNICGASSPAIATVGENAYLLIGCDDGYVYRIKLSDRSIAELNVGGCVESSPAVSGNNAYIGVSIYGGQNVRRISIEPLTELASWQLGPYGEESRASISLEYDFAYNGIDTGYQFLKMDANATGSGNDALAEFGNEYTESYFVGSAAHITGGIIYTGNDNGRFYALDAGDLHAIVSGGYYDETIQNPGFVCSSPAISYNVDANHNRWVFITTRSDGGKLYAFKTER